MIRLCLRLEQMELAKKQNPTSFDFDVDWIDWQLMKLYQDGADGIQTLICNGVNTKSRAARHFGVDVSPHCEHGMRGSGCTTSSPVPLWGHSWA